MLGYDYNYKTNIEILSETPGLLSFDILTLIFTIIGVGLVCVLSFVVFPSLIVLTKYRNDEKAKRNKKKLLTQILLQKELEDEVEKEVKMEEGM